MFSLVSGLYNYLNYKPSLHILIVGLDHAGKSTLLEFIKGKYGGGKMAALPPEKILPTLGMNIVKLNLGRTQVVIWDVGGQPKMRGMWQQYYSEADGVIFLVDSDDHDRLEEAKEAFQATINDENLIAVPIMVLANKQDLPRALDTKTMSSIFNNSHNKRNYPVFGISAITGRGVDESLMKLISEAKYFTENH